MTHFIPHKKITRYVLSVIAAVLLSVAGMNAQFTFDYPGATETYVTGMNNSFHICGYATFPDGSTKAFVKTKIDTLLINYCEMPEANTWAGGINDLGEVVCRYHNGSGGTFGYFPFKVFYPTGECTLLSETFGYEFTSPNAINNEGWISGDLKDGSQRRIFTYHPDHGMSTNFVLINGQPIPTYGGDYVDAEGKISCYWIEGISQRSGYYKEGEGFSDTLSWVDPSYSQIQKMNLKGGNADRIIAFYPQSKRSQIISHGSIQGVWGELYVPHATAVYATDMNDSDHLAGYYLDEDGKAHGFFQADELGAFAANVDGFNMENKSEDLWGWEEAMMNDYLSDPYWWKYHDHEQIPFPIQQHDFTSYTPSSYIPWPDWVRGFGEEQCYHFAPNVDYVELNQPAFQAWRIAREDSFSGGGFGMCVNAWWVYHDPDGYYTRYPETEDLFYLQPPAQTASNMTATYCPPSMRSAQAQTWSDVGLWHRSQPRQPLMTQLGRVYELVVGTLSNTAVMTARVKAPDGGTFYKTLIPTKMERVSVDYNKYKVYYYDPRYKSDTDRYFTIEYGPDYISTYTPETLALMPADVDIRLEDYDNLIGSEYPQLFNMSGQDGYRESSVKMAFLHSPDLSITASGGGEINVIGEEYSNSISGAEALNSYGGYGEKSHLFKLDPGEYSAAITAQSEGGFGAYSISENGSILYERNSAVAGDTDNIFSSGTSFGYRNQAGSSQDINALILTSDGAVHYSYYVDNIGVSSGQDISLQIIDATRVMITSSNASTTYDVRIRVFNPEVGFWEASAAGIAIGADVSQLLIPVLTLDNFDGITVETDADGDGIYEDSDFYPNGGTPVMVLSHYEVYSPNTGSDEEVFVSNIGGGNLNWTVVSSPDWVSVNAGLTGVNHGAVQFTVAENNDTNGRQGYIIIQAAAPANEQDTVLVTQGQGTGVGIDKINLSDALVSMMPNPAKDYVLFSLSNDFSGTASYSIYNATGQLVRESKMHDKKEIVNTSELNRGIYQVKFILNGSVVIKKLVLS